MTKQRFLVLASFVVQTAFCTTEIYAQKQHSSANVPAEQLKRSAAPISICLDPINEPKNRGPLSSADVMSCLLERPWEGDGPNELVILTNPNSTDCVVTATTAEIDTMPKWLADHFAFMTSGSGRWVTDNAKYKSTSETFDEYGTEWKWGVGKQSIKGRLFALKDGREVGEFWEYRVFWHPGEKRAVFEQFGAGGVFASGEMRTVDTGDRKPEINTEMTFYAPDGTSWHDLHKLTAGINEHITRSFNLKDGMWQARRIYQWRHARD